MLGLGVSSLVMEMNEGYALGKQDLITEFSDCLTIFDESARNLPSIMTKGTMPCSGTVGAITRCTLFIHAANNGTRLVPATTIALAITNILPNNSTSRVLVREWRVC